MALDRDLGPTYAQVGKRGLKLEVIKLCFMLLDSRCATGAT